MYNTSFDQCFTWSIERRFSQKLRFISMMNGQDFITNRREFHERRSRFSSWQAQILIIIGSGFHCLLLRLKSRSARGACHHPAFMGNCPAISRMCYAYLPSRRVFLFVPGVAEQNEDTEWIDCFIFWFLVLIHGIREEGESKIYLYYSDSQRFGSFPSVFSRARWHI